MGDICSLVLYEFSFVIMNSADDCHSCHNCQCIEIAIDDTPFCLRAIKFHDESEFSTHLIVVEKASFSANYETNYSCQFFCRVFVRMKMHCVYAMRFCERSVRSPVVNAMSSLEWLLFSFIN